MRGGKGRGRRGREGKGRGREREGGRKGRRKGRKGERDLAPQKKNPSAATVQDPIQDVGNNQQNQNSRNEQAISLLGSQTMFCKCNTDLPHHR